MQRRTTIPHRNLSKAKASIERRRSLILTGLFFLLSQTVAFAQQDSTKRTPPPTGDAATAGVSSTIFSLQQCIDSAVKNNPAVNTAGFAKSIARNTLDQERANMLPSFSGYANYVNNGGRSINIYTNTYITENYNSGYGQLQGSLVLYNGSAIRNLIHQYSLLYQADKMDLQQAKDLATVNTILAYLNVLSTEEQLGMAERQAEATRKRVDLLAIQNKEGSISPSDLSDMKGQLGSDELTVANTQNALEANKLALAQLMNIPYSPRLEVAPLGDDLRPVAYGSSIDQIYQNAIQNLAQVKAADLHVASAAKGVKATRGSMAPTLSLFGQVYTNYSTTAATQNFINTTYDSTSSFAKTGTGTLPVYLPQANYRAQGISFVDQVKNNVNTQVGLQLAIPIMNGLHLRTQYRQAQIALEQARFNASTTRTQLKQSVESYYVNMTSAFRTYNVLNQQVQDYTESYRSAEIKYDAGALKSIDFIIYKTNIDRSNLNLIQAKYNYILQTKVLDYFQGLLTWSKTP